MATVQPGLDAVVQEQLAAVLNALDPVSLGHRMADRLLDSIPELRRATDKEFRATLVLSCQSNLTTVFDLARRSAPLDGISPPPEAIAWAHELVYRGVELPALLRAYRLGHELTERRFVEVGVELELDPEVRWRTLAYVSHYFFAYVDTVCTRLVEHYEQERARWIRGAAAARSELLREILQHRPIDASLATKKLRYDVTRRHIALIIWSDPREGSPDAGALEEAAVRLAAALGGGPVLTSPVGEHVVWAWTAGEDLGDDATASTHRLGGCFRAAVGTSEEGLAGMAESHERAQSARRVAELRRVRPGTVVRYGSVGLTALLAADPAEAIRFAELELGTLLASDDTAARLRATARVYLEENLSAVRSARRLGIHQNTVVYRIKRVEELLGHQIEQRRLHLELALRLAEVIDGLRAADRARRRPG